MAPGGSGLVAVTGATGFIGRRLVPALAAAGYRARVLARRPAPGQWGGTDPEIVVGDLADEGALSALTAGAGVVIHAAGAIKAMNRAAFFETNEGGSARVAQALVGARMIHISSLAAREPGLSDYAASKRAGETAAQAVLGERLTVLRPPAIYGPGDRETLGLFQLAAASPVVPLPRSRITRLALVHVDDVIAVILSQLQASFAPGVFAIGGARPQGYGWREIFGAAAQAMGRKPAFIPLPDGLIRAAGAVSESLGRLRGAPAIFTGGKVRELLHPDWTVAEAEQIPGDLTRFHNLEAGFRGTVAWYRAAGWLR